MGAVLLMGRGAIQLFSMKQKVNTRSLMEAELVGVDDMMSQVLWTILFLMCNVREKDESWQHQSMAFDMFLQNGQPRPTYLVLAIISSKPNPHHKLDS